MNHRLLVATLLSFAAVPAQDLIGIDFAGHLTGVNTDSGGDGGIRTPTPIAPGAQAMARKGGTLYVASRTGSIPNVQFHLDAIDANGFAATRVMTNTGHNLVGLASMDGHLNQSLLYGVANATPSDNFVRINLALNTITVLGPLGFANVSALTQLNGVFYAWDTNAGLLTVNPQTGAAIDPNPSFGTGGIAVEFLTAMSDGRLLGGRDVLYRIHPLGIPTQVGSGTWSDFRGAEEHWGKARSYGASCAATFGVPVLQVASPVFAGSNLSLFSTGHLPGNVGVLIFGGSRTAYGGFPLPFPVDNMLGTVNCHLRASPDVTVFSVVSPAQQFTNALLMPPGFGGTSFFVQHAVLDLVPGGMSFTNGVELRVGF